MSISSPARRALLAAVAVAATVGLVPAQAHAVPDTAVRQEPAPEAGEQIDLATAVAERAQTLADLNRRADARDRAIAGEKAVLARFGYLGDPDAVQRVLPLASYSVSAGFGLTGPLWESSHTGQDLPADSGETLVAVSDATVTAAGDAGPYGLQTILTLADGTEVWYNHQMQIDVTVGETVEVAQPIGAVGSTGNSTGSHLHLEVRPAGGDPSDPMAWLRATGLTP